MRKIKDCPICPLPNAVKKEIESSSVRKGVELGLYYGAAATTRLVQRHNAESASNPGKLIDLPDLPAVEAPEAVRNPKGWEQGVKWERGATEGILTLPVSESEHAPQINEAAKYLRSIGFNPDEYDIEPYEVSKGTQWNRDSNEIGKKHTAYTTMAWRAKFKVFKRSAGSNEQNKAEIEELIKIVSERVIVRAKKKKKKSSAPGETFLVGLADWQTGKRDGGGLKVLMERLIELPFLIKDRIKELQTIGRNIETIVLMGLGDLIEGCVGFYPSQTFMIEAYEREQVRIARRALVHIIEVLAELNIRMVVSGIPGNHGENRQNGKAFTNVGDNADLAVLEQVAEIFDGRKEYAHVSFVVPKDELFITLDLSGIPVLFAHGHGMGRGFPGMWSWFKDQRAHSNTNARIMWVGHYHHLHVEQDGILTITQSTALEDQSDYYKNARGPETTSGTTTALVSNHFGQRDLQVLLAK